MQKRSSKQKRPRDLNALAHSNVVQLTGEGGPDAASNPPIKPQCTPEERSAAAPLPRIGGPRGGKARAAVLTPEQRRDIAKKAGSGKVAEDTNTV